MASVYLLDVNPPAAHVGWLVALCTRPWVEFVGEGCGVQAGGADAPSGVSTVARSQTFTLITKCYPCMPPHSRFTRPSSQGWSSVHLFSQQLSVVSQNPPSCPNMEVQAPEVQT